MKTIRTIPLLLFISLSGWAQVMIPAQPPIQPLPPVSYSGVDAVLDSAGDLFVFDTGRSTAGVTITGLRHSFYPPQTTVSMQTPGNNGSVLPKVTYDNTSIQVIGAGTAAIYAIATVYTVSGTTVTSAQSLIAFVAGQGIPSALSGLHPYPLTAHVEVKVGPSDNISLITRTPGTLTTPPSHSASVVHFDGTSFHVVSTGTF